MANFVHLALPAVLVTVFPSLDLSCCRRPMVWRVAREGRTWFGCPNCHAQAAVDHERGRNAVITSRFNEGAEVAESFYSNILVWESTYEENKECRV